MKASTWLIAVCALALGGCCSADTTRAPSGRPPAGKPDSVGADDPSAPHLPYYYNPNAPPPNDPALPFFNDGT